MDHFFAFGLTFVVGLAGFFLFRLIKFPNPGLLGSMFATGILNIAGYYPSFPTWLVSFLANAAIGVMIGRQVDRNVINRIRVLAKHVFVQVSGMLVLSLVCGYVLYTFSDVSLKTALISSAAGGITEMIVFGMSVDADVAVVALVQVARVAIFLVLIPYISMLAEKLLKTRKRADVEAAANMKLDLFRRRDYPLLIVCSLLGAWLGNVLRVPAGSMLGAMVASGAFALFVNRRYIYDMKIRFAAQIALGMVLGGRLTSDMVSRLGSMLLPTLVVTIVMLVGCVGMALHLYRKTGWDLTTCLLCSSPAGLSQITVYAEEIGLDSFTVSVFHTVRIMGIVSLYPWIIMPFIRGA